MTLRPEFALHHSGFEPFLFASVWEERDGSSLSILSAFARLDVDPWAEAARLASMPREKAAAALSAILKRLPRADLTPSDYPTLACELVALLPERAAPSTSTAQQSGDISGGKAKLGLILALSALLAFLQANGWLF